jgi:8-oxo-dGTP diphosphatase
LQPWRPLPPWHPVRLYRRYVYFPLLRLQRLISGSQWVAAGALIFDDQGRILLIRHRWRQAWEYPVGVADPGESPLQTAKREVHEEVGLRPDSFTLLGVDSTHSRHPNGNLIFTFSAHVNASQASKLKLEAFEARGYRWVTRVEAQEIISDRLKNRFQELLKAYDVGHTAYLESGQLIVD